MKNFLTDNLFTCSLADSYSSMADGGMMSGEDLRRKFSIGYERVGSRRMYFIYNNETGKKSTHYKTEQEAQKSLNDKLELAEAHYINKEKKGAERGKKADGGMMANGGEIRRFDRHEQMDSDTRGEILDTINEFYLIDGFRSLQNYLYGLFDGYDYSQTDAFKKDMEKLKSVNLNLFNRIENIFSIIDNYSFYSMADGGMMARGGAVEQLESIKETNTITERQINLIKNRLNSGKSSPELREIVQYIWDNKPVLDAAQTKKGYDFLYNFWKSPTGKERANSPYGYREEDVLTNFLGFQLSGFWDVSRYGQKPFLVPLYIAEGVNNSFEYYYWGTKINIVG